MAKLNRPLRILQVHGSLRRGGAETWFMDVVRNTSREEFAFDVCVLSFIKGAYEEEFLSLGGRIFRCPLSKNIGAFSRCFKKLLRSERYDIVHSHQYYFTGFILRLAAKAGVPKRIAHIHPVEDTKIEQRFRGLFTWWMKRWIQCYGTHFVGPSKASLEGIWGPGWKEDPTKQVIYNGIQVERFVQKADRDAVRHELNIPKNAPLVINVGRFVPHKRHGFLVQVAEQVFAKRPNVYFLLIGVGALKETVKELVRAKGIEKNFRFISGTPSIDRYWLAADVLAFPSCNEGFGIVVIEASAAGLKVIAQDIPGVREAAVACYKPVLLPLETTVDQWCQVLLEAIEKPIITESQRQTVLEKFPFTIENSVAKLKEVYNS